MRGVLGCAKFWFRALALVTVACGDPEDETQVRDGQQTEAFCDASCTRAGECGSYGSHASCQSYCEANVTGLDHYRPEAVEIAVECIVEVPCSRFYEEGAFLPCWDEARKELGPNRSVREFCQVWSRRWYECGSTYSTEECEFDWAVDGADYLEAMLACTDVACDAVPACVDRVAGQP